MPQSARGKSLTKSTLFIINQHLWLKILIGMGLGIGLGILLSPEGVAIVDADTAYTLAPWIKLPGVIFLGLIQMVIVPLVVCSIILGIADTNNLETVKRLGLRIVPYFLTTTAIAVTIGIVLVQFINPGSYIDQSYVQAAMASGTADSLIAGRSLSDLTIPDRLANMIPTNPAQASLERNMLQIVVASILVGLALLTIAPKNGKPFKDLCLSGQMITMKIVSWAMAIASYAVFGLLCDITIRIGMSSLLSVAVYMGTVLAGLFCMFCIYCLIVKLVAGRSIKDFLIGIREVQLLAFSTSSSAATMPFSIKAAEEKLDISEEVSRFVVPLGATINMDGTALYQAIAALFLCQVFGVDLSASEITLLLLTTVGASIGTPAMPGVGIVVLATILTGIGVPPTGIALILGVDRILDMCRTTINVTGDLTATTVMQRWLKTKQD